jgi:hypothetical protein
MWQDAGAGTAFSALLGTSSGQVHAALWEAVWHIDANLSCLAICQAVNLSLARGNGDGSCPHHAWLGCIAGPRFGDYAAAFRLGQLGCALVERERS